MLSRESLFQEVGFSRGDSLRWRSAVGYVQYCLSGAGIGLWMCLCIWQRCREAVCACPSVCLMRSSVSISFTLSFSPSVILSVFAHTESSFICSDIQHFFFYVNQGLFVELLKAFALIFEIFSNICSCKTNSSDNWCPNVHLDQPKQVIYWFDEWKRLFQIMKSIFNQNWKHISNKSRNFYYNKKVYFLFFFVIFNGRM